MVMLAMRTPTPLAIPQRTNDRLRWDATGPSVK